MWPDFVQGEHHKIFAQKLEDVANGKIKRLIINMPPRHTKSEFASVFFPSWLLGINPKLSETLVNNALLNNCFHNLKYIKKLGREKTIINSRFDFIGVDKDNRSFILEVKAVPLADYDDIYAKERKKKDYTDRAYDSKISYFPDGYRKKLKDTVSPRALKHVQELEKIKQQEPNMRCILCFVIQRTDVKQFQPSLIDPIYRKAVQKAWINGVEIFTLQVSWSVDGVASFYSSKLPVCLFETYGPRQLY